MLLAGDSASSHDRLICRRFASTVSVVDSSGGQNSLDLFARAVMLGRQAARRPGYLSADMAKHLTATDACNNARAVQGFMADCRAVGVYGPVWPEPYATHADEDRPCRSAVSCQRCVSSTDERMQCRRPALPRQASLPVVRARGSDCRIVRTHDSLLLGAGFSTSSGEPARVPVTAPGQRPEGGDSRQRLRRAAGAASLRR